LRRSEVEVLAKLYEVDEVRIGELDGRSDLVIDLGRVEFMDSAGVAVLVSVVKAARLNGSQVVFAAALPGFVLGYFTLEDVPLSGAPGVYLHILLWAAILALWTVAVTAFSRGLPEAFRGRVLAVMGLVSVGFLLFMLLTSNPFERLLPVPADGRDLNPLLQDPGLIIHPPMLYVGYVGFSVAFAFAIAAMLSGKLDQQWARWTRPWTTTAWMFLTVGI